MKEIRKGDIFLNNAGSKTIKGVSIAERDCEEVDDPEKLPSPPEECELGEQIYWVPVSCYELFHPIRSAALEPKQGKYVQEIDLDTAKAILEAGLEEKQPPEVQKILKEALDRVGSEVDNNDDDYVNLVKSAKNVIFHGAPGTGKTYLAKQVAAKIVSNGKVEEYSELSDDQKSRIGFVQFYPGYDYSNFVEGFRPQSVDASFNGGMKFTLEPGIFKRFVARANIKQDLENRNVTPEVEEFVRKYLPGYEGETQASGHPGRRNPFRVKEINGNRIIFDNSENCPSDQNVTLDVLLRGPRKDSDRYDYDDVMPQQKSYYRPMWKYLEAKAEEKAEESYVFIIDEINRGNTSGIFGELFYAIDPGNRGPEGEVTLQYSKEKFYVPDNILLIGTMNDIDRSVEPFDFAFRRRWNFKEIKPKDTSGSILDSLVKEDPKLSENDIKNIRRKMGTLNKVISQEIGEDYQIGAAYFFKLKDLNNDFEQLWDYDLFPLLKEYVHGMDNEEDLLNEKFPAVYYGEN